MEIVKKRMPLMKNLPVEGTEVEDSYEHLNLLGTIKLPKNLANLTKDLPKANYISNRGDSASIGPSSKSNLIQSHPNQIRLQSEPALPNSRQLPSIYAMRDPKYIGPGGAALSEQVPPGSEIDSSHPRLAIDKPRRIPKPVVDTQQSKLDSIAEN
jgi:hypothetical protein